MNQLILTQLYDHEGIDFNTIDHGLIDLNTIDHNALNLNTTDHETIDINTIEMIELNTAWAMMNFVKKRRVAMSVIVHSSSTPTMVWVNKRRWLGLTLRRCSHHPPLERGTRTNKSESLAISQIHYYLTHMHTHAWIHTHMHSLSHTHTHTNTHRSQAKAAIAYSYTKDRAAEDQAFEEEEEDDEKEQEISSDSEYGECASFSYDLMHVSYTDSNTIDHESLSL